MAGCGSKAGLLSEHTDRLGYPSQRLSQLYQGRVSLLPDLVTTHPINELDVETPEISVGPSEP